MFQYAMYAHIDFQFGSPKNSSDVQLRHQRKNTTLLTTLNGLGSSYLKGPHTCFNLVVCNRYRPLSCVVYGSKLLSCSLTAKVASELRQCLFQATSCVKDQRHRNFVTSHLVKLPSIIITAGRGRAYVQVFAIAVFLRDYGCIQMD